MSKKIKTRSHTRKNKSREIIEIQKLWTKMKNKIYFTKDKKMLVLF